MQMQPSLGSPIAGGWRIRVLGLLLLLALTAPKASAALDVAVHAAPDPVLAGDMVLVEITVTNPTDSFSGPVRLEMPYPTGLSSLADNALSDGGDCTDLGPAGTQGSCAVGETVFWELGALPPRTGKTVFLPPGVDAATPAGTPIDFSVQALESGGLAAADSRTVVVVPPVLNLQVHAASDPVAAGAQLTYVLTYGNRSAAAATGTELRFPLPAGTSFLSASGGGVLMAGVDVVWDLGTLQAGQTGRRQVTLQLGGGLAAGDLLEVDTATLGGTANFLLEEARASTATRVGGDTPLGLAITANAAPTRPEDFLQTQLTVTNQSGELQTGVRLELWYPGYLDSTSDVALSDGGDCTDLGPAGTGGSCSVGETVFWELGSLPPGAGKTVSLPPSVVDSAPDGLVVPLQARVSADSTLDRWERRAVGVESDRPLTLLVDAARDPVAAGAQLTYVLTYGNRSAAATTGTELRFPLPAGTSFLSASGGGVLSGAEVVWSLGTLDGGAGGRRAVTLAVGPGLGEGALLELETPATLTGTDSTSALRQATATASARVETGAALDYRLAVAATALPGDQVVASLTLRNRTGSAMTGTRVELFYPRHLASLSDGAISDGGDCTDLGPAGTGGSCHVGETVFWELGTLAAGQARTVFIPPTLVSGGSAPSYGTLIRWFGSASNDFGDRAFVTGVTRVGVTADTDFDGMSDDFEHANGLNPNDPGDAGGDPDLDGLTNFEEFEVGTDPNDPDSDADRIIDGLDAQPAVASNLCSAGNVLLQNLLVPAGTISQCGAPSSIAVAATVSVEASGLLVLTSPAISLAQGFALPQGGELRVQAADPTP